MRVGCFRSFKPAIHFGAKLRLTRLHAFVAHRLVFGGVRLDLRAVERDMPQLRQPGFFRQLQHLQKQPPQRRQMTLPEVGDRAKIWRVVRHDHHEIDPLGACLRDPPRGIKTRAIGIEQQGRHHARIERRLTKPAFVACDDLQQIQVLARQSDDELRQMVRRHIIDDRRRQELCLINCPRTKMSAHASMGIRFAPKMPPLLGHAPSVPDSKFVRIIVNVDRRGAHPPHASRSEAKSRVSNPALILRSEAKSRVSKDAPEGGAPTGAYWSIPRQARGRLFEAASRRLRTRALG